MTANGERCEPLCPFDHWPTGAGEAWDCPDCGRQWRSDQMRNDFNAESIAKHITPEGLDAWSWTWSGKRA